MTTFLNTYIWAAFKLLIGHSSDKIRANVEESRTLAALRDTLLMGLVSGEVHVDHFEGFV